ncbi:MAG: hypothetical protein Q4C70_12785, partial [Planctomycetia bacterium]|nr:hypothetical protein [Planctomycetia bacterium]
GKGNETHNGKRPKARFVWAPTEKRPELIWRSVETAPESLNASGFPNMRKLNLFQEPGFRVYVTVSLRENWTKVLLQFHHSVSDGLGEMQVIGEFLTLYARHAGLIPEGTPLPELKREKLSLRCRSGWSLGGYLRNVIHTDATTRQLAYGKPTPLFVHEPLPKDAPTTEYPFLQALQLSREETRFYIQKAKKQGVTVNDLLLRDFFVTIETWRKESGKVCDSGILRVMVPTSLRKPCHDGMPAANVVSSVFLDRTRKQIAGDSGKLLSGIHREMERIKRHDQKYVFTLTLSILAKFGVLNFFLRSKKCRSTGVLSNLGRVLELAPVPRNEDGTIQLGDCRLLFVDAAPPIRFKTLISFSALTYAGALRLCLRYDSHFLTPQDAEHFLSIFHGNLLTYGT